VDFISKLRPVEYIRNNNTNQTKEWGVIAQELQQILQDIGYQNAGVISEDKTKEKYLAVRYNDLLAPMIKAIQEQQKAKLEQEAIINNLQKKDQEQQTMIQEQQQTIAKLLKRMDALEKK
jgi:uncharacterized protein YktB (UPF0637 family)